MSGTKYVSTYDALQWAKKIANLGYDTFMFRDLPDNLHTIKYLRKALSKGYIYVVGEKRISGTFMHIYACSDKLCTVSHTGHGKC